MEPEYDNIINIDINTKDIIQKLLIKDQKIRLGYNNINEIMLHPYFHSIDFDQLDHITPSIVPTKNINMATQSEIGTFSDIKSFKNIELNDFDNKLYDNWDFISIKSFQEEIVEYLIYEDITVSNFIYLFIYLSI